MNPSTKDYRGAEEEMILTYKIKHGKDFSEELRKAKKVAHYAILTRSRSSKDVKHLGLKSMIANQILRKYSNDGRAKQVKHVKLAIPHQGIRVDRATRIISAPCLALSLRYDFPDTFEKVNQIEVGEEYAYISISIPEPNLVRVSSWIGVDRNTTGHIAVVSDPETGKVLKLGKTALHIHQKYKNIRKDLQHKGKYGKVKQIKDRERRIVKNINHNVSRKIVDVAKESGKGIKLEDLTDIRQNTKQVKSFRYAKNSWSFYQLQIMIEYKAKLRGVEVAYVDPAYTSKECSRCGQIGTRNRKEFKCPTCGHVDHADSNAGFNIAKRPNVGRLQTDRDACKGNTDIPIVALARIPLTTEPTSFSGGSMSGRQAYWEEYNRKKKTAISYDQHCSYCGKMETVEYTVYCRLCHDALEKLHLYLNFSRVHYLKVLKQFRDAIANGMKLESEDSNVPGCRYNYCTWGMCSMDPKMWPEPSEHRWPYSFFKEGRVAPLSLGKLQCPLDWRTEKQNDGNGCFWTCRNFQTAPDKKPLIQEFVLQLYDERIVKIKAMKKGLRKCP